MENLQSIIALGIFLITTIVVIYITIKRRGESCGGCDCSSRIKKVAAQSRAKKQKTNNP